MSESETFVRMDLFETLEQRLALSLGAAAQEIFYPDGYAHNGITEVVTISNPDMITSQYELWARYETGQRDQLISSGTVAPGGFVDVSISDPSNPSATVVRKGAPFAFVLRSTGMLTASLRHDDFGGSAGESFISRGSDEWSLPAVTRDRATTRDFVVLYNPVDTTAHVTLEFWGTSGLAFSLSADIDGLRRGGWNINSLSDLAEGEYGVRIRCSHPIVVGHSHYNLVEHIASINIATFDRGSLAGAVLSGEFDDRQNHEDSQSQDTLVAVFNPGNADATVTFHYIVRDDSGFAPAPTELHVPALGRQWISMRQLGFAAHDVSIIWESDVRVAVASFSRRASAFVVTPSATAAATQWYFASAFVDRVNASVMNTEDVLVFNPTDQPIHVSFVFTFRNGATAVTSRTIGAFEVEDVDAEMGVQGIGAGHPFSIAIDADGPVIAALEHWNHRRVSGQFASQGLPRGDVTPLSEVLVIPTPLVPFAG